MAHCPRLTPDWLSELPRCPQLRELDISGLQLDASFSRVVTACGRLTRLRLAHMKAPLQYFPTASLPGLTHLDLSHSGIDDDGFRRLAGLLPGLRDLRLQRGDELSEEALVSTLAHFSSLQVLDLRDTYNFLHHTQTSWLRCLPLKALAYNDSSCFGEYNIAEVLHLCPTLAALCPRFQRLDLTTPIRWLPKEVTKGHRELTLFFERINEQYKTPAELPRNLRLVNVGEGHWEEWSGWRWWQPCCCTGHSEPGTRVPGTLKEQT